MVSPLILLFPFRVASLSADGVLLVINSQGGDWMQVVNGKEERIVKALREYGLCEYEARMYFTTLTIGEAKAGIITRKASVPNSKTYRVLEDLIAKGFAELSNPERPEYRAIISEKLQRKR
jgi:hypothetical protein